MNLANHIHNNRIALRVVPHSSRTELKEEGGKLKLHLQKPAEDNKANLELIRFFKKEYKLHVTIVSGLKSREKVLKIL